MNKREFKRKQRMDALKAAIIKADSMGLDISYNRLVAMLMVEEYVTRRNATESVDCLISYGFCRKEGDTITLNDEFRPNTEEAN